MNGDMSLKDCIYLFPSMAYWITAMLTIRELLQRGIGWTYAIAGGLIWPVFLVDTIATNIIAIMPK